MFRLSSLRNYRANESRAEFTPAMPSAADNARSERVAEARVSRSLRWLHVAVQLERLYISVANNTHVYLL